jgi:hypothetical protein
MAMAFCVYTVPQGRSLTVLFLTHFLSEGILSEPISLNYAGLKGDYLAI